MPSPSKPRTVRFAQVIKQSGKPRVHTLWVAPEKDKELRQAEKTQRVMTITEPAHGRAWVGEVGLNLDPKTAHQYLIFPRTLRAFAEARVVGINLDTIVEARLVLAKAPRAPAPKPKRTPKPAPAPLAPEPEPPRPAPPKVTVPKPAPKTKPAPPRPDAVHTVPELIRVIRAAMRELKRGHATAAQRTLENAIGEENPRPRLSSST